MPYSPAFIRFALLGLGTCSCYAHAAEDTTPITLEPLVITGVAPSSPLKVVTDPRKPRQPMPASDGADYLKTVPGFNMIRNGGTNGDPVFRGMFGSRLNILDDGGMLQGACPGRMDPPTSYIAPENFDRLEIIKGPQSVRWGPMGSAATVLFQREPERFKSPDARVNGSVMGGSHGRFDRRLDAATGDHYGYVRVLGNRSQSDDYKDGNNNTVPSRWNKWQADMSLGLTDEHSFVELTGTRGDGYARYAGRSMDGNHFKRDGYSLRGRHERPGETLSAIEGMVYHTYLDHVMDNFHLRQPDKKSSMMMMRNPMAVNVDREIEGGRLASTWRWNPLELVTGFDIQHNTHKRRTSQFNMKTQRYTSYRDFNRTPDAKYHQYGFFTEGTLFPGEASRWVSGARIDRVSSEDRRRTLTNPAGRTWANPSFSDTRFRYLPGGFLRYERDLESSPTTAYAGLGHAERFPDYWELFSPSVGPGPGPGNVQQAFTKIDPEKTTQLDIGLQYRDAQREAWVSAYAGVVEDYILFNYQRMPSGHMFSSDRNIQAHVAGAELGGSQRFANHWQAGANLAYAWGENHSDHRALPQMPPLDARFTLNYERNTWSLGGLWRVVAKQGRIARGEGNVVGYDYERTAGFSTFSVNGGWKPVDGFSLTSGIDNLFNRAYSEHLNLAGNAGFGYPADNPRAIKEPGRIYWAKLDFKF